MDEMAGPTVKKKVYIETSFVSTAMKDEIIEEVWKAKDDIARECGYDLNKLAERLREAQRQGRREVVDFTDHRTAGAPVGR